MKFSKIIAVFIAGLMVSDIVAQNTSSGYFCDGNLYRHEANPAVSNEQNYVAMPILGNVNVGIVGNVGLSDFFFSRGGKTVLFTNSQVSSDQFLKNIHDRNVITSDVKLNILSMGFKLKNSYNTIGVNLRTNADLNIPGELLRMAKEGPKNKRYDISSMETHADAFLELAFGHSREITDEWQIGAKIKILLGVANLDARFDNASFELNDNRWNATCNAEVQTSMKGLTYKTKESMRGPEGEEKLHKYVSGVEVDKTGINGFGLAADLGAIYKLDENWKFGASLLDLGFIKWNNNMVASTNGEQTVTTESYIFSIDKNNSNSFKNELDRLAEDFSSLYELQNNGDVGARVRGLGATINLSAEYSCPFYRPLSFGLLNVTKIRGAFSSTEFRLSANISPCKMFSGCISLAEGTYGPSFGWLVNLHPKGFNMYMGMDHTFISLAKPGLPLNSKSSLNVGVNFPF